MEIILYSYIQKFSELITLEEFKLHINSYTEYKSAEDVVVSLENRVHDYLFVSTAPWFRKKPHEMIVEIIYLLCKYYAINKQLPFSAYQALADGSTDYMDVHILEKVLAVARTWE